MKLASKGLGVTFLVVASLASAAVFAWLLGVFALPGQGITVDVLYHFAGGVEVGSPVRVSGVKVGRVEKIEFLGGEQRAALPKETYLPSVKLNLSVSKQAAEILRDDSRFYINMAGIIGERYVEITPGTEAGKPLVNKSTLRGIDPPRIDQLLSQGYNVFGKVQEFLERNEKPLQEIVESMESLIGDVNKALKGSEKKKFMTLVDNLATITTDFRQISHHLTDPKTKAFFERLSSLVEKANEVDRPALKKFLQEEGVRARIF